MAHTAKVLTIAVAAYNVAPYIAQCLDSFVDEKLLPALDIVVIDDGSTDATAPIVKKYINRFPESFRLVSQENGGYGAAVNHALALAQGEYFNNPISVGEVFENIAYGKVPALSKFKFLVVYGDPAPGESKGKKGKSFKTVSLCGKLGGRLYVIKTFLAQALNAEFIDWYVRMLEFVGGKTNVYCYMENNKLQDPFFQQVFKPLVAKVRREQKIALFIRGDEEKKTDKATRIEANLEPLNREGNLILNEAERDNPHMKELEDQFKLFTLTMRYPADGPDAVEGANRIIDELIRRIEPPVFRSRKDVRKRNKKRL